MDLFRNNLTALYIVYLVIAVSLIVLYMVLMPYLIYNFRGRNLQDIIGEVAEETPSGVDEGRSAGPGAGIPAVPQAAAQGYVAPNERHMETLSAHTKEPLTRREYQVVDCILQGLRRAEIARELQIKPDSVTKYANQIYSKFNIHRRQDLFRLAEGLERGEEK